METLGILILLDTASNEVREDLAVEHGMVSGAH